MSDGGRLRRFAFGAIGLTGMNRLARLAFRQDLLTVCYHGVCGECPDVPDPSGLHVPEELFEEQIRTLLRYFRPVSLSQVKAHWMSGSPLPESALLVTFDDGYRNMAKRALPILRRYVVPCAIFLVAGAVERRRWIWTAELEWRRRGDPDLPRVKAWLKTRSSRERREWLRQELGDGVSPECDSSVMNWDEARAALEAGEVEIGSHGLSHEPLTTCDPVEARIELQDSQDLIRRRLDRNVDAVAYPDGDCSASVVSTARECGYSLGFTTRPRHARPTDDALALPRMLVGRWDTPTVLAGRVSGWLEWIRP